MVVTDMIQIRFDASVVRDEFKVHADFQLPAGSTTALVGPNGAGKSTVLAAIAGLEPAHSGEIEIGGVVVDAPANAVFVPSRERNVGVVFQQHLLFPHLSVLDNVAFGLRSRGLSKADARSRAMPVDTNLLADQLIVLEAGEVVQVGSPDAVRRQPKSAYIASFAGENHLRASVEAGQIAVDGSTVALQTADRSVTGPALVTIAPSAIALHRDQPGGSPRNVWSTQIASVEVMGDVRRVMLGAPFELAADLTPGAVESMGLRAGQEIWASVKATEIRAVPLKI